MSYTPDMPALLKAWVEREKAVCDAATPGPWESPAYSEPIVAHINRHPHHLFPVTSPHGADSKYAGTGAACVIVPLEDATTETLYAAASRADFIATTRTHYPALLAYVDGLLDRYIVMKLRFADEEEVTMADVQMYGDEIAHLCDALGITEGVKE